MRKEGGILLAIVVIVIIGGVIGASYYRGSVQKAPVAPDNSKVLVRPDSATIGPADAKVTVVEFLDPECESCAAVAPQVKALLKEYEPLRAECSQFLECIRTGATPRSSGEVGARVTRILEAAEFSLRNAGQRVDIEASALT